MDISDIVSTDFVEFTPDARVSKIVGAFDDPELRGVVIRDDPEFEGVVTRRQLATSHHPPDEKARSLVWHVPRLAPDEDVREVAQLMIDSDSHVLPVFDGERMVGVVTADGLLAAVQEFLDAATVEEAYSDDLVTVGPEATFGEALHVLREHRITHLPVVEGDDAVGMLSLYDVTDLTAREMHQSQGGDSGEGGVGTGPSSGTGRTRGGGFGARDGESHRMLDLPVRDVMVSPVRTVRPGQTLEEAVHSMFEADASSLVVVRGSGAPAGIVTKTDVLRSLTWGTEADRAVQVYGTDLLDDMSYDAIVAMIDEFDDKEGDTRVQDAKIHLHEHDERRRGTPLLLARIRLFTDRGLYIASGQGFGASHAINEARHVLERRLREDKTYGRSKKHPDEEYWERRFGWLLEGE